jgi:uncharacterized membrane protein YhaH (DUF805 family)
MDPFDVLFSFKGRLNRKPFWLYQLAVAVATSVPFFLGEGWLAGVLELWAQAALSVKRAHDRGRSGWFVLVLLVPLVQIWPFIVLWFLRGTAGDNQYGPDPLPESRPKPQISTSRDI